MRITNVDIPKGSIKNGLEPVKMDRLGQVVLLAGKNGSGKTRLLNLINNIIQSKPNKSSLKDARNNTEAYEKSIKIFEERRARHYKTIDSTNREDVKQSQQQKVQSATKSININLEYIKQQEPTLNWKMLVTDKDYDSYPIVPLIPKNLGIKDCNNFSKNEIDNFSNMAQDLGVNHLINSTLTRIQKTQERWFNATHQDSRIPEEEKEKAINDYNQLKTLIKIFLNTNLERNINGDPTLFGLSIGQSMLSDGQKVLIQLCVAIHCQQKSLDEIIIFLDEPENHLHPSVIIEIIERMLKHSPNGQIWIATHSIPLLSYFDPSSIWFIENNKVAYAGTIPGKVLESLLGDENRISKLQDFISLPGIFALNQHAFESLFRPAAVLTSKNDPQTLQIRDEIKKHLVNDKKIRILDYGAGKGRLLANIIENDPTPNSKLNTWFDYIAFDNFVSDSDECKAIIKNAFLDDWEKRYFNKLSDLDSHYDKESFDIVIMCNVLHEIPHAQWLNLLKKDGDIPRLLHNNGILLLVEDQEMQIGEKAYQNGFIVLDTPELKELFCIKESDSDFGFSDARNDGRLKAHRINREYLTRITEESKIKSLELLHQKAKKEILAIRKDAVEYKNGKKHGFWTQQYANAGLILDELTNKS